MKGKQVVANFKMNLDRAETRDLCLNASKLSEPTDNIVIAPQMPVVGACSEWLSSGSVSLAAQNCSEYDNGARTGESSAKTLKSLGAEYVIIGHSERRAMYKSEDARIFAKLEKVLEVGLKPILCVGEPLDIYEKGFEETKKFLGKQLDKKILGVLEGSESASIAYEPIWSIGTGKVPSLEEMGNVVEYIRGLLLNYEVKILYGGSVNGDNSADILSVEGVDGVLVGSASLNWDSLSKIILSARVE